MSSITTPIQTITNIQIHFSRVFSGKISAILPICIMKKINLEVSCKRNCFGYWNSSKGLQNFVKVSAQVISRSQCSSEPHESPLDPSLPYVIIVPDMNSVSPSKKCDRSLGYEQNWWIDRHDYSISVFSSTRGSVNDYL